MEPALEDLGTSLHPAYFRHLERKGDLVVSIGMLGRNEGETGGSDRKPFTAEPDTVWRVVLRWRLNTRHEVFVRASLEKGFRFSVLPKLHNTNVTASPPHLFTVDNHFRPSSIEQRWEARFRGEEVLDKQL